ncbi:hypothetical protein POPTR_001G104432v4 [Populus trichocarpa]|uniref:Uncharacterized protein n=1 Tax=Populus trichocarpa TaxID=3694 RepID=A0ACC0TIB3_POPTR|nr:hypothetical protein BDE02_01G093900 [Populus trichocarpa]KAI9401305.1 hypothetical protein POPTR_001G104432v4 [Populus trichocarpa]
MRLVDPDLNHPRYGPKYPNIGWVTYKPHILLQDVSSGRAQPSFDFDNGHARDLSSKQSFCPSVCEEDFCTAFLSTGCVAFWKLRFDPAFISYFYKLKVIFLQLL